MVVTGVQLLAQPASINLKANRILLNGDDWCGLIASIEGERRASKFTVVHIGDSHIQPGIVSSKVGQALQQRYGNGGRGLVCPLRLAGTNAPSDYELLSTSSVAAASKLLSSSKPAGMGLTGVAVKFAGNSTTLKINTKQPGDEFYRITMLHSPGDVPSMSQGGRHLKAHRLSDYATDYVLQQSTDSAVLQFKSAAALYGIRLLNSKRGVVVDCIGNNGATYSSYLRIDGFARQLKDLAPNLVIISLGTNEAYGKYSSLANNIDQMLSAISRECPGVKFLLTTPLETHKKGGRGYVVQSGIAGVRDIIMDYGKKHHIPVWDFYTVGGGNGAAARWLKVGYMKSDHLHLSAQGYRYVGDLLAQALTRLLSGEDDGSDLVDEPRLNDEETDGGNLKVDETPNASETSNKNDSSLQ